MVIVVCIINILLVIYIIITQQQLRKINQQLHKRLIEKTRQPLSLELLNKDLNMLAANINKCLKAEEALRLESFREENRFKEMIANISHDLRTPLTAIKGYQQLMEKGQLSEEQYSKLSIAKKHADELGNLIEEFFEYSYVVSAKSRLDFQKVNITNLVSECLASSIAVFEENDLKVFLKETTTVFTYGDKEMIIRIIQNLINNCIRYSISDISVKIRSEKSVIISFSNMVEEHNNIDTNQVFERFYTANKSRGKSTGLGLSIVKMLAEEMGGSVRASLKVNIITIYVELPLYIG